MPSIQLSDPIMKTPISIPVGAVCLLLALPTLSHHSFTAEFDVNRPIEVTGTVTNVEWTNPHAWFYVDVEGDDGAVSNWAIELLGINTLYRRGWTRDRVKPGDVITVTGFGARDGSTTANASTVILTSTGETLWEALAGDRR